MFWLRQSVRYWPRIWNQHVTKSLTRIKCPLIESGSYFCPLINKRFIQISPEKQEHKTIVVPPLAESVTEGDVRVEKKVGDQVKTDEVVMEIETDKTSVPIPAPAPGVITELLVKDGDVVKPGQALFKMDISGVATTPEKPLEKTPEVGHHSMTTDKREEQRVKMNKIRLIIAQRLKETQNTTAMLTTFNEIDMSALIKLKIEKQDDFEKKHKVKLGFMSAFLKASAAALKEFDVVNAVIENHNIIYRDYVDISIAVATPKGLVVPVIKDVDKMDFAQLEKEISKFVELGKSNTLTVEAMTGGTFSINNSGVYGSVMGMPIINLSQSAILGMHATYERPISIKGKIEIRPMMYVALTYDHRLIDGREAVLFLRKIKSCIEEPSTIATGV